HRVHDEAVRHVILRVRFLAGDVERQQRSGEAGKGLLVLPEVNGMCPGVVSRELNVVVEAVAHLRYQSMVAAVDATHDVRQRAETGVRTAPEEWLGQSR